MNFDTSNSKILNWPAYPLVRIVICYVAGIYLAKYWQGLSPVYLTTSLVFIFLYLLVYDYKEYRGPIIKINSVLILLTFVSLGLWRATLSNPNNDSNHYIHEIDSGSKLITGQILQDLSKKKSSYATKMKLTSIDGVGRRGDILLYFNKSDSLLSYEVGDYVVFRGYLTSIGRPKNPLGFDYQEYMANHNVHGQVFLRPNSHALIRHGKIFWPMHYAQKIRKWASAIFKERFEDTEKMAVLNAMVLGDRADISDDLKTAFSETGAVHVLAVSGLHVGIILLLFNYFFRRTTKQSPNRKKNKKIFWMILIVITYALITGASPAVVRATLMFSTILIGRLYFDYVNTYNILAFSALCILTYDPMFIYDLGFLFSYLALISIVFFQPYFMRWSEKIYNPHHKFGVRLMQLVTVSLAAQLLIFPISVHYFHSFPVYFVISGVCAVFAAPFVLGAGLLMIPLHYVPVVGDWFQHLLDALLAIFINVIYLIRSLPGNSIKGVWLSTSSMFMLYGIVLSIMYLLSNQKTEYELMINASRKDRNRAIGLIYLCVVGLLGNSVLHDYRNRNCYKMTIYAQKGGTLIDIYEGGELLTYNPQKLSDKQTSFTNRDHRIFHGNPELIDLDSQHHLSKSVTFGDRGMMVYGEHLIYLADRYQDSIAIPMSSDILLVANRTKVKPYHLLDRHQTDQVILDQSLPYETVNRWKAECKKRRIPVYDVRKEGAFEIILGNGHSKKTN